MPHPGARPSGTPTLGHTHTGARPTGMPPPEAHLGMPTPGARHSRGTPIRHAHSEGTPLREYAHQACPTGMPHLGAHPHRGLAHQARPHWGTLSWHATPGGTFIKHTHTGGSTSRACPGPAVLSIAHTALSHPVRHFIGHLVCTNPKHLTLQVLFLLLIPNTQVQLQTSS